jgi:polyphosphate kinase 2 (PPK2 family)
VNPQRVVLASDLVACLTHILKPLMRDFEKVIDSWRVSEGAKVRLKDYDPAWAGDSDIPKAQRKLQAEQIRSRDVAALATAQELLYAADSWTILVLFQAMDAAGKDSTIKHVMPGANPQGCQVHSFKHPSAEELDHNFLWRYAKPSPSAGRSVSSIDHITKKS